MTFPSGSIVTMDKGYVDYKLFWRWTGEGVFFVTRQKDNARYRALEERPLPKHRNILRDQIIKMEVWASHRKYPGRLRRVEVWDEENKKVIVLTFGSSTITAIYKDRWQIEIFFNTIKQHLRIKTFVGTSPHALLIQIWTALIAVLILKCLKYRSLFQWSVSNLVAMLRYNLFTYRDLWAWMNQPFEPPPMTMMQEQLPLNWTAS